METETLAMIVSAIIVIAIIIFIAKRLIKVALVLGLALLLFNVGFVLSGTEVRDYLHLDNFLSTEQADKVEDILNDFDKKREEYGIIDADKVYEGMENAIANGAVIVIEGLGNLDIKAFADTIAEKIVEVGEKNIDTEALRNEIKSQLGKVKEEQMDQIMDQIDQAIDEKIAERESSSISSESAFGN